MNNPIGDVLKWYSRDMDIVSASLTVDKGAALAVSLVSQTPDANRRRKTISLHFTPSPTGTKVRAALEEYEADSESVPYCITPLGSWDYDRPVALDDLRRSLDALGLPYSEGRSPDE